MSKIEWTEQTWNPVTGCDKVSAGCKHCYAEVMAKRLQAMGAAGYERGFEVVCHEDRLVLPLGRKTPTMYFVNSMSDLFHEKIPCAFIDRVFDVIAGTPRHTYQILTKRPEVMVSYFSDKTSPANAWLGVSVENKRHGVPRIDELRKVNARVRFLSVEPLLEDLGAIDLRDIDWVIVGGESGAEARRMHKEWVDNIYRQCREMNVPFFFKQWGAIGVDGVRRGKGKNGRLYEGRVYNEYPINLV